MATERTIRELKDAALRLYEAGDYEAWQQAVQELREHNRDRLGTNLMCPVVKDHEII